MTSHSPCPKLENKKIRGQNTCLEMEESSSSMESLVLPPSAWLLSASVSRFSFSFFFFSVSSLNFFKALPFRSFTPIGTFFARWKNLCLSILKQRHSKMKPIFNTREGTEERRLTYQGILLFLLYY